MGKVEFTAVILAATCGARLYPLTTSNDELEMDEYDENIQDATKNEEGTGSFLPKHLLPLAGRPLLHHLLEHCEAMGMESIVLALSADDDVTKESLLKMGCDLKTSIHNKITTDVKHTESTESSVGMDTNICEKIELQFLGTNVTLVTLPSECAGSADALRCVISANIIDEKSHVMVLPADLVLFGKLVPGGEDDYPFEDDALGSLADVHRREYSVGVEKGLPLAMSMLLSDVGEEDANGIPFKESAKAKKGGIAREDEDIEYIGISTIENKSRPPTKRVMLKQSKYNVEEDEDNTGSTPKLHIPKARLHSPSSQLVIKTSWSDLHVFCFSPWVIKLLQIKCHMKDLAKEFVPFLISRQFRGIKASFGVSSVKNQKNESDAAMEAMIQTISELKLTGEIGNRSTHFEEDIGDPDSTCESDHSFLVSAKTLSRRTSKLMLRACTIPAYVYACREVVFQAIASSKVFDMKDTKEKSREMHALYLPGDTLVDKKFSYIALSGGTICEKVQIKSSTIGHSVKVGNRCRLNNVVIHDNVTIGENCVLQNSILSNGCTVENNCNLKDCQIGPGVVISTSTKAKGESF